MPKAPRCTNWSGHLPAGLSLTGDEVAPVASAGLLVTADSYVEGAAFSPYCQTGHMVDLMGTGLDTRRIGVVYAPGTQYARVLFLRSASASPTTYQQPANFTVASVPSGGMTGVSVVTCPPLVNGTEAYLDCAATPATQLNAGDTSAKPDESALTAAKDRALKVTESNVPTVVEYQVAHASSFAFQVVSQSPNLESL